MPTVTLEPVSPANRERCVALDVEPEQRRFVASVAEYLAMCDAEGVWTPVAVCYDGEVVGFAMWGFDEDEGSHWIGGVLVDSAHQGRGVGRAAMRALIGALAARADCREIALSHHPDNAAARGLYRSLGFRETGERTDEGEVVARLAVAGGPLS